MNKITMDSSTPTPTLPSTLPPVLPNTLPPVLPGPLPEAPPPAASLTATGRPRRRKPAARKPAKPRKMGAKKAKK